MRFLTRNLPAKLGSVLFALVIWYFISTSQNTQASSEFTVPVVYDGLGNEQVVRGAPVNVLVKVIGLKDQLNRLNAENFSAVIDFSNTEGAYEKEILVVQPQGITIAGVTPATAIGTVESIARKTVPIETSLLGSVPEDVKASIRSSALEARVLGVSSSLEQISKVIASVPVGEGEHVVSLFAATADNVPIRDSTITVSPSSITTTVDYEAVLFSKQVSINLGDIEDMFQSANIGLSNVALSQDYLTLIGPKDSLNNLNSVDINVEPLTGEITGGEYTLKVEPILPEGVVSKESVTLNITLVTLPEIQPLEEVPGGALNDPSSTTIRRSGFKEASLFNNLFRR